MNPRILWFLRILSTVLIIASVVSLSISVYMVKVNPGMSGGISGSIGPEKPLVFNLVTKGDVIEVRIEVGDMRNITKISLYFDGEKITPNIVNKSGRPMIDNIINTKTIGIHTIKVESTTETWCDLSYGYAGLSTIYLLTLFTYIAIGAAIKAYLHLHKRKRESVTEALSS